MNNHCGQWPQVYLTVQWSQMSCWDSLLFKVSGRAIICNWFLWRWRLETSRVHPWVPALGCRAYQACLMSQNICLLIKGLKLLEELSGIKMNQGKNVFYLHHNHLQIFICSLLFYFCFEMNSKCTTIIYLHFSALTVLWVIFKYEILFKHEQLLHQREAALCSFVPSLLCSEGPILHRSKEVLQKAWDTDMLLALT